MRFASLLLAPLHKKAYRFCHFLFLFFLIERRNSFGFQILQTHTRACGHTHTYTHTRACARTYRNQQGNPQAPADTKVSQKNNFKTRETEFLPRQLVIHDILDNRRTYIESTQLIMNSGMNKFQYTNNSSQGASLDLEVSLAPF